MSAAEQLVVPDELARPYPGCETRVYFIQCNGWQGPIKIGSAVDVQKRLLGMATGNPYPLVLLAEYPAPREVEWRLHKRFRPYRIQGEWFDPAQKLREFINIAKRLR